MAEPLGRIAELFFGGDQHAARCLFEQSDDQTVLHVPGGARNNPILSTDWMPQVATLIDNNDLGPFEFDVILKGTAVLPRELLDLNSQPSAPAIDRALRQGATLRVLGVSRFDPKCAAQLQLLRRALQRGVFVNLYLTPAQQPGLNLHYDLEDSLVVQVRGEKHWRLYEAGDGPKHPIAPSAGTPSVSGEPTHIHMRAGDVLFVPSGVPHTVETRQSPSQHITFGVRVSRQIDLLGGLLEQFAGGEEALRRPVRSGEHISRGQLADWANSFERWLREPEAK